MPLFPSCRTVPFGTLIWSCAWRLCSLVFLLSSTRPLFPCLRAKLFPTLADPSVHLAGGLALSFYILIKYVLLLEQLFNQGKHSYPAQRQALQMMLEPRGPSNSAGENKMKSGNLSWYRRQSMASYHHLGEPLRVPDS